MQWAGARLHYVAGFVPVRERSEKPVQSLWLLVNLQDELSYDDLRGNGSEAELCA
jgi:hypothetical protein